MLTQKLYQWNILISKRLAVLWEKPKVGETQLLIFDLEIRIIESTPTLGGPPDSVSTNQENNLTSFELSWLDCGGMVAYEWCSCACPSSTSVSPSLSADSLVSKIYIDTTRLLHYWLWPLIACVRPFLKVSWKTNMLFTKVLYSVWSVFFVTRFIKQRVVTILQYAITRRVMFVDVVRHRFHRVIKQIILFV